MAPSNQNAKRLDVAALESWLWEAACQIRGPLDAPKFKDYILPLIFLKRLSDVFEDEVEHLAKEFKDAKTAAKLVDKDHKLVRFYVPPEARWASVAEKTTGLGEYLTDAVRAISTFEHLSEDLLGRRRNSHCDRGRLVVAATDVELQDVE